MKLEDIGFYTLSDERAMNTSGTSPMQRCEMILTDQCNFKCKYCKGIRKDSAGVMPLEVALSTLNIWIKDGLRNVRFSGGEPTMYPHILTLVEHCKKNNVQHIAISTNGSASTSFYQKLIDAGCNDFSISLDACATACADKMSGAPGKFNKVVENIQYIAARTYTTCGVVLTEENVSEVKNIVEFAHNLGVSDIRIISAAQFNKILDGVVGISQEILDAHPILKYRVKNIKNGRNVRGLREEDSHKCHLVQDDNVVAGNFHFPCVIHMREQGNPIGIVGPGMRDERLKWFERHDPHNDPICSKNCLDVCQDYNNKCEKHCKVEV